MQHTSTTNYFIDSHQRVAASVHHYSHSVHQCCILLYITFSSLIFGLHNPLIVDQFVLDITIHGD